MTKDIKTKEITNNSQNSSNGHIALPKSIAKANEQHLAKVESVGSNPISDAIISKDWKLEDNFCLFDNPSNEYLVKAVPEIYVKEFLRQIEERRCLKKDIIKYAYSDEFWVPLREIKELAGKSLVESI